MATFNAVLPRTSNSPIAKLPRGLTGTPPANVFRTTLTIVVGGGIVQNNGIFTYIPPTGTLFSSAGVFQTVNSREILVRTLWSGKLESTGSNTGIWDGRLDDLTVAKAGNYSIQITYNAVTYDWMGVIANPSYGVATNEAMHRGYAYMSDIEEIGSYVYFTNKYVEGESPLSKFDKNSPQTKLQVFRRGYASGCNASRLTSDGNLVYVAYQDVLADGHKYRTWVSASKVSDDTAYTFSAGGTYTPKESSSNPMSTLGLLTTNDATNPIIGLAVQKVGNLIFVCHNGKIDIYNKTTSTYITSNTTLTNPRECKVDKDDNLVVINGSNTISKFSVDSSGNFTSIPYSISVIDPLYLKVNVQGDGTQLLVAEGGASQTYSIYSYSSGAKVSSYSQTGGYISTSTVSNDRHYLSDTSGSVRGAGAAFTSDGGVWLIDSGNFRTLNFNSSKAYVQQIAYLPNSYCSAVDINSVSPTLRVFHNYLEYKVNVVTQEYTLVANWRYKVPSKFFGFFKPEQNVEIFGVFPTLVTLSNGRTYTTIKRYSDVDSGENGGNRNQVVELVANQGIRFTPLLLPDGYTLDKEGNVVYTTLSSGTYTYWIRKRTGFDASGNLILANAIVDTPIPIKDTDPIDFSGSSFIQANQLTSTKKRVSFQPNVIQAFNKNTPQQKGYGYGYHLGIIDQGATTWNALTARATSGVTYIGDYPTNGDYDIGNHARFAEGAQNGYAGGNITVLGRYIFWNYYGEFWKDGQTNKWQFVLDNGLFIGQWGPTSEDVKGRIGYAGMAGGVHFGTVVPHPTDPNICYIIHAEEGGFSGLHIWKITGLLSISTSTVANVSVVDGVNFQSIPKDYIDLHEGLPYLGNLGTNTRWSQNLAEVVFSDPLYTTPDPTYGYERTVLMGNRTNLRISDRFISPGITTILVGGQYNKTFETYTDLGTINSKNWRVVFNINYTQSSPNDNELSSTDGGGIYREIRDNSGKVIVRTSFRGNYSVSPAQGIFSVNGTSILTGELSSIINLLSTDKDLSIQSNGTNLSVKYGEYGSVTVSPLDSTAVLDSPKQAVVLCWHKGNTGFSRDRKPHTNWSRLYPNIVTAPLYPFTVADATLNRIDSTIMDTMNVSTSAQLKSALSSNLTNKKIVVADGTYTDNFEQTGTWTNVWLTSASNNTTITSSGSSVLFIFQGANPRNKVRLSHIKFNYTGTGNNFALLYWNELATYTGLEIDNCEFTCPNGNVNALGCSQYSTASLKGNSAQDVYIHHNKFKDIGRIAIELLNQKNDVIRMTNLIISNNTFSNLGLKDARHGMSISLSGRMSRIGIDNNTTTDGAKYCIYELVNVENVVANDNDGISLDISTVDGKPSPCAGWSISKDDGAIPQSIYINGGVLTTAGRPIQAYDAEKIFVDGKNKLWKGNAKIQLNINNSLFKNINHLHQGTNVEAGFELSLGYGNIFRDMTTSSAGSTAAGKKGAFETFVARSGTHDNQFINITTILGTQSNGQAAAPSPSAGSDGRLIDQGTNNTIINNIKSVVS